MRGKGVEGDKNPAGKAEMASHLMGRLGEENHQALGTRLGLEAGKSCYKPWKMAVGWGVPNRSPARGCPCPQAVTPEP